MTEDFKQEQRTVALAMAVALVVVILALGAVARWSHVAGPAPFAIRLQLALRIEPFVVVWLAAAIGNVARLRFFSERDIGGSAAGSASAEVGQAGAILQNTFEQVVLTIFTHLIVVATFSNSVALIEAMVILFAVGRLLFWAGYAHGAKGRAFGFALGFYASVVALIAATTVTMFRWIA